ncbi:MAG: hypothetical protein JXB88_26030 [Spirochaetales bacterium]|nr:hypothetical protein [Spirochaetales bacterium]
MRGIPEVLNTKDDWLNTYEYVIKKGDTGQKAIFISRLQALKESSTALVLKPDTKKSADELNADDFKKVHDPASSLARSDLEIADINLMIKKLK